MNCQICPWWGKNAIVWNIHSVFQKGSWIKLILMIKCFRLPRTHFNHWRAINSHLCSKWRLYLFVIIYCAKKKHIFHLGRGPKNFSSFAEHLFGNPEIPLTAFFPVLPPSLPFLLPSSPLLPPFLMLLKFSPDSLPHLGGISLQNRIIIIITSSLAFSSSSHCLRCSSSLLQILDTPFSWTTFCALYNF